MSWRINEEQRLTLRPSPVAMAVLEEDKLIYGAKSNSQLLCRIFENHYATASASIGRVLAAREQELTELLGAGDAVSKLLERQERELLAVHWEKGEDGIPIRVRNRTRDILESCQGLEGRYYKRYGQYFRAVLEDYCRLSPVDRQRVYFAQRFARIQAAMAQGLQLRVRTQRGAVFLMHPCVLSPDKLMTNWYLAGYSRLEGEGVRQKQPASFRVASLDAVEVLDKKAVVSAELRRELDRRIVEQGIQFLLDDFAVVQVRMSPRGVDMYSRLTTLRPICHKKNGDLWEFHCTLLQAERYFVRMGAHCKVEAPEELRQRMAKKFADAAEIYK